MARAVTSRGTAFQEDATAAGWEASLNTQGGKETVRAAKADLGLEIVMIWDSGVYNYPESFRMVAGERKTIRNASEARRLLSSATGVKIATRKVPKAAPRPTRDFEAEAERIRPAAGRLPFKVSSPDAVICKSVVGKTITWWNEKKRTVESASVLNDPNQKHLRIVSAKGRRVLCWAAAGEGFRSIYVDAILEVSR